MKRRTIEISRPADVLLVEDNPGDVRLILEAMKEAGFRNNTTVAGDGLEALAVLRREGKYSKMGNIDIVILDLNLPKIDGRQVLTEIKKDPKLKHIPVVVLSSSSAEEDIEKSYNSYANCSRSLFERSSSSFSRCRSAFAIWISSRRFCIILSRRTRSVVFSPTISSRFL